MMKSHDLGIPLSAALQRTSGNRKGERKFGASALALKIAMAVFLAARLSQAAEAAPQYPLMHFTPEQMQQFAAAHRNAPQLSSPMQFQATSFPRSLSLLSRLPYVPAERNQGGCGDCWQWAGTGVMEIAHDVQNGVHERLSVQFINSCNDPATCCYGGWLDGVASFYSRQGFAIPWANPNAQFVPCAPCGNIVTAPRYPVQSISTVTIPTYGVGQAQAIANIKSALNQNKAIWFGFFMWTGADWNQFFDFWYNQSESAVWPSFFCGRVPDSGGAGHAVLCVGYNEDDPANRYWIMVNSWGTTSGRPNGIFRIPMDLNYDCTDGLYGWQALYFETLDIQFGAEQSPLRITSQPQDRTVTPSQTASFNVNADGIPAPSYLWYRQPAGTANWVMVSEGPGYSGTTTATLLVNGPTASMSGDKFACRVSNSSGSLTSTVATLTVIPFGLTTIAGQAGSAGQADGIGSMAAFSNPYAVAADGAENLYVADCYNATVRKITPGGVVSTLAGLAGNYGSTDGTGSAARFSSPTSVAVDKSGNVYVTDEYNATIRKITAAGVVTTLAGLAGATGATDGTGSSARFYYPSGLTIDNAGTLYVADYYNHTIRKIVPNGTSWVVSTLAGSVGNSGSADGSGSNARFHNPAAVAADLAGNVYVADFGNSTIRKLTQAGVVTTVAGLAGAQGYADGIGSNARFGYPVGITVDVLNNLYVTDQSYSDIRRISPRGVVSTLVGLAGGSGNVDGIASDARLTFPLGLSVAPSGNLYVADTANQTIRKYMFPQFPLQLTGMSRSGGVTRFALNGPADVTAVIQSSSDLVHWAPLSTTVMPAEGRIFITDSGAANQPNRYYRATASVISMAATSGTISSPFVAASGYVSQPVQTGVSTGGRAVYTFTVANAGNYLIQALVNAPNGGANSFYVNIDAEPQDPVMNWNIPVTSTFAQRTVCWEGTGGVSIDPKVFNLTQGAHQLIIRGREANTQLKSIAILPTP